MKNLEIKAKVKNLKNQEKLLKKLEAKFIRKGRQVDSYFIVPHGRLKLRKFNQKYGELIFYKRKENSNQRWSNYFTFHVCEPDKLNNFLQQVFKIKVIVDKIRILYRYKNARIHLDRVVNLGKFIEIEVKVKKNEFQAKKLMKELLEYFKILKKDFIKKSYSDLL
jgi:predicted adenylyl cyclase CyaB